MLSKVEHFGERTVPWSPRETYQARNSTSEVKSSLQWFLLFLASVSVLVSSFLQKEPQTIKENQAHHLPRSLLLCSVEQLSHRTPIHHYSILDLSIAFLKGIKLLWNTDMGTITPESKWKKLWNSYVTPICISLYMGTVHQKISHRWHRKPVQLSHITSQMTSCGWRGCRVQGTFFHLLWECLPKQEFWLEVYHELSAIYKTPIQMIPQLPLLNVWEDQTLHWHSKGLITWLLEAFRVSIAQTGDIGLQISLWC